MAYLYLAEQIGIAGAFAVWAYVVAKGLFARSSLRLGFAQEVALLVPAGLGVAILLLFGLGIAGALTGPGILAGAGLLAAFACWRLRARIPSLAPGTLRAIACAATPARLVMIAVAGTVLVPVALDALTPPVESDEVRYHLPYALHFVEQGRIVPDLYLRFPFFTLNVNLLYAAAIVFGDDVTPHYVHLLLGVLAGLALYALAAPRFGRVTAFCAVLLFFVTPNFTRFAATAYIDLGLAAFVTAAIACLDRARDRTALVVCAGLAFGAALGTKYLALAFLPLLIAWAAYRTRAGGQIVRFAAVAVVTGAPWYVYNLVWTGNPVSPFAGEWLGAWPWTAEDLAIQVQGLTRENHERSLAGLLSFPYYLVTDSWRFSIPPVPVLLLPGLAALALLPWWNANMRPYGLLVLVVIVAWFLHTPYFRYLTAILPLWCLISVWSVERALSLVASLVTHRRVIARLHRRHVSYAAAAIVLALAGYHFWQYNRWLDRDAVTERVVHRDRFLRERIPVYGVVEHLRRSKVRDEVIYSFPSGALHSYVRTNRVVGDVFGPMGHRRNLLSNQVCPERSLERLRRKGVSLLVLTQRVHGSRRALNHYLASRATPEYADRYATVYRIESGIELSPGDPPQESPSARHAHVTAKEADVHLIPYFPVASGGFVQGAVRLVNHSDESGTVVIQGVDDSGTRYGPTPLALQARETRGFDSDDWVACDLAKRVSGGLGENPAGSWWLSLATDLDIEASSYIRTGDGFLAPVHEVARTTRGPGGRTIHHVPFFDPGTEGSRTSHLRLINPGHREVEVTIAGRDDAGAAASEEVRLSLPGGTACWLGADVLESGASDGGGSGCDIISGRLGDGEGRWRLSVTSAGGGLRVMSLLMNPTGHLTNLSGSPGVGSGGYTIPLALPVPGYFDEEPRGFVRIVNHSGAAGTVKIHGIDDAGASHGPVTLALDGRAAVHLDSGDLETGNASKGLHEGLGDGAGSWRLRLATELDVEALAYAGTESGSVTAMHEVASRTRGAEGGTLHYVPLFNSGRNRRQASRLRLSNSGRREAEVTIEGRDHFGVEAPKGAARLTLPAGQACTLGARTLESGKPEPGSTTCTGERFDFDGRLGQGSGGWSLLVIAEGGDVRVMSLLENPAGHLANVSGTGRMPADRPARRDRLDHLPDVAIVRVERWGPRSGRVGEPFNVQPNGSSSLWFRFLELDRNRDYEIHVGSQPAATAVDTERNLITAGLTPRRWREVVAKEGEIPIHLVVPDRGKQLIGHFHVHRE